MAVRIDEEISSDGLSEPIALVSAGEEFLLQKGESQLGRFSLSVLLTVVQRYARPLDLKMDDFSDSLSLHGGMTLYAWRYRAPVDLEKKLYLVLEYPDGQKLAVLARQISSALRFVCHS